MTVGVGFTSGTGGRVAQGLWSRQSPESLEQPDLESPWAQGVEQALAEVALQEEGDQTRPQVPVGDLALSMSLKGGAKNR